MAFGTDERGKIELGLRVNIQQFSLLVLINAFVGGMVGIERTILPLIAEQDSCHSNAKSTRPTKIECYHP